MHMSVRSVACMRAVHACSAYVPCTHTHTYARAQACMDARTHTCMHARMHVRTHAQACDALHPYNVQGRAQATHRDVRELVPSWVPKALVRWHVTGQSRHARDTGHPAGCRRPAVAPCDAVGTGFRAGKWPKNYVTSLTQTDPKSDRNRARSTPQGHRTPRGGCIEPKSGQEQRRRRIGNSALSAPRTVTRAEGNRQKP